MLGYDVMHGVPLSISHADSSAAFSSGTSDYGNVPEQPSSNDEPTSRDEERTGSTPSSSLVPTSNLVQ